MKSYILLLLLFLITLPAHAQEKNARLDVFTSQSPVAAGDEFDIALRQTIRDGWHTYWKNAGDSGEPISIEWELPDGVNISDIRFPTPHEIHYDPLVNYGFEGTPTYLQTVTIDSDFRGEELTLNGKAFWLVCKEICIPESQSVSLSVPIGANGGVVNKAIFNSAKEAMPEKVDWQATLKRDGEIATLTVVLPEDMQNQFTNVEIYPYDWGVMVTTEAAIADIRDNGEIIFTKTAGDRDFNNLVTPQFVIKTVNGAYLVTANTGNMADIAVQSPAPLLLIILFAFIGGLILNLMPCVFPVLSMKALSLIKLSDKERRHAQISGLAYTAGILVSFISIAGLMLVLKAGGASIGWGFQLQNPYVVSILATLLFLITLNLAGVFEIGGRIVNLGSRFTGGNDTKASFFTGVLACIVATPCSAPFMASALGYAMTQSAPVSLLVFVVLGLGLAFPYLLLCYIPQVQKILPKPGAWMHKFRRFLAVPMGLSVLWLVWVLYQQSGMLAVIFISVLFLALILMIELWQTKLGRGIKLILTVVALFVFAAYSSFLADPQNAPKHENFTQAELDRALAENPERPVFVNMTAAWCITCLMNERTSLSKEDVKKAFEDNNVLYMKGDWTNRDAEITKYLEAHGRNGVPLYVYYRRSDENGVRPEAEILPQILTPTLIIKTVTGD